MPCATCYGLCCVPAGDACQQELCLAVATLLVLQQPQDTPLVSAMLQHVLWLLQCAVEGLVPPAMLSCKSWTQAVAACVGACAAALQGQGLLGLYADR